MKKALLAALACLLPLPLLAQVAAPPVQAPAPPVPATAPTASGAKTWVGQYEKAEEFLRTAPIERVDKVPVGVTKPERGFFAPGGFAPSAAVKHLPMSVRGGFWESYKSEIAAYQLDLLLGLDMVPPTVERRVGSDLASVQLWVEGCRFLKDLDQKAAPDPTRWADQVWRQRVFDNLIANIDRNEGNLLVDAEWNLILIDHSRAFALDKMPFEKQMERIDKDFFSRLKALDEAGLRQRVRPWLLNDGQMKGILERRDKIVAIFEKLAKERPAVLVFPF